MHVCTCEACSYTEELHVGCGMSGICLDALHCATCRRVVETVVADFSRGIQEERPVEPRCPHCDGEVGPWGTTENDELATTGPCPKCGAAVGESVIGIWD